MKEEGKKKKKERRKKRESFTNLNSKIAAYARTFNRNGRQTRCLVIFSIAVQYWMFLSLSLSLGIVFRMHKVFNMLNLFGPFLWIGDCFVLFCFVCEPIVLVDISYSSMQVSFQMYIFYTSIFISFVYLYDAFAQALMHVHIPFRICEYQCVFSMGNSLVS